MAAAKDSIAAAPDDRSPDTGRRRGSGPHTGDGHRSAAATLQPIRYSKEEAEAMTNATPTAQLSDAGVSIWLDDLSRERLDSGSLQKLIDQKNVVGVTTNPSIFQAAITSGTDYDD